MRHAFTIALALTAACSESVVLAPSGRFQEPMPLFSDADVDRAVLELAVGKEEVVGADVGKEEHDVEANPGGVVSPQGVASVPGAFVTWISHDATFEGGTWSNYAWFDGAVIPVYSGEREIQSVAVSGNGNILIFAMRRTVKLTSNFEIFRFNRETGALSRLTDTPYDETNASLSANGRKIVWEGESPAGKRAVFIRERGTESVLARSQDQIQPSVSGDGNFIALVRPPQAGDVDGADFLIWRANLGGSGVTYTRVARSGYELAHPSVSNNGEKVAYIERQATRDRVRVKNMTSGVVATAISLTKADPADEVLDHPHVASDGTIMVYARILNGRSAVFSKNLMTGEQTRIASGRGGLVSGAYISGTTVVE